MALIRKASSKQTTASPSLPNERSDAPRSVERFGEVGLQAHRLAKAAHGGLGFTAAFQRGAQGVVRGGEVGMCVQHAAKTGNRFVQAILLAIDESEIDSRLRSVRLELRGLFVGGCGGIFVAGDAQRSPNASRFYGSWIMPGGLLVVSDRAGRVALGKLQVAQCQLRFGQRRFERHSATESPRPQAGPAL